MPTQNRTVKPSRRERTVITEEGSALTVPNTWELLPPGDAPLTRLVKSKGPGWLVKVKKGRRFISQGFWTEAEHIRSAEKELAEKRSTPEYARSRKTALARKEKNHQQYVEDFHQAVLSFLAFHDTHQQLADRLAGAVTELATPVGSGTVARTQRIPLEDRVRSAVIAWLRHQTTAYDCMKIARIKGNRRAVRRQLSLQSLELLEAYRTGKIIEPCPLEKALNVDSA